MAVGIDQPFRGLKRYSHRIDLAIVDDVEDRKIASNPRRLHERCEKITRDLMQAFHKDRRRLVLCNNLSTRQGIIAHLMAQMKHLKNTFLQRVNLTTPRGNPTGRSTSRSGTFNTSKPPPMPSRCRANTTTTPLRGGVSSSVSGCATSCPPLSSTRAGA